MRGGVVWVVCLLALQGWAQAPERLYRLGVLPTGQPLRGTREAGASVEGATAACATCHRRSGLGSWEGQTVIPPVVGRVLFAEATRIADELGGQPAQGKRLHRPAYTEATLERAIRDGVGADGRALDYLMPRYRLDPATLSALVGYLKTLGARAEPGVGADTLHFATVVTPDADPSVKKAVLGVLQQFFQDKNAGFRGAAPALQRTRGVMYRVQRRWDLQVWELTGAPASWGAQLEARARAEPVLAIISGLGGGTWAPVHDFCERSGTPCLFPNVALPVASAERDFYSVYFSRGVLLEAELMGARLKAAGVGRVVQVYGADDVVAEAAAKALPLDGVVKEARPLGAGGLAGALAGLEPSDGVVLWLRPAQLATLGPAPPSVKVVLASGLLGGLELTPLPPAWRPATVLTYPVDLPEQRQVRMNFPRGWFSVRHLPVVDERAQTDTYLACVILSETLGHMQETFTRDFLVERVEVLLGHRLVNGYYPRLALAPGERFASKGGYLVRLAGSSGTAVQAEGGWQVP